MQQIYHIGRHRIPSSHQVPEFSQGFLGIFRPRFLLSVFIFTYELCQCFQICSQIRAEGGVVRGSSKDFPAEIP
jgi:hypothetical protein